MASTQDSGGGDGAPRGERMYKKEYSLYIDVGDNNAVKPKDLITEVNKLTGSGKLYACVPKSGNMYVLTFKDKTVTDFVSDGVQCGGKMFHCKAVKSNEMDVSFMNVDPYVPDGEIISKMEEMNLNQIGNVRRIKYEDTDVENGTRVVKVRKAPNFVSLPYLMRLSDGESSNMYRVIHDNQRKLCHNCHKEGHLFRECPNFVCYRCSKQGHFKRQCKAIWCQPCFQFDCGNNHDISDTEDDEVDEDDDEFSDDNVHEESDVEECMDCGRHICICSKNIDTIPTQSEKQNEVKGSVQTVFENFSEIDKNKSSELNTPVDDPKSDQTQQGIDIPNITIWAEQTATSVMNDSSQPVNNGKTTGQVVTDGGGANNNSHIPNDGISTGSTVESNDKIKSSTRDEIEMQTEQTPNKRVNSSPGPTPKKVQIVANAKGNSGKKKKKNK